MDRRDILADNPVEKRRGYMPGVSVQPRRLLFTAGLTGRLPDGSRVVYTFQKNADSPVRLESATMLGERTPLYEASGSNPPLSFFRL